MDRSDELRRIPSVDRVLSEIGATDLPRAAVLAIVRRELAAMRAELSRDSGYAAGGNGDAIARIRGAIEQLRRARLQPVINGTGVIVHTNFGRSPLGETVVQAISRIASNYNNLEYDLTDGARGGRAAYLEHNLAVLCAAEAATVVNNCAAALVLVLRHFAGRAPRTDVIISRGELVQIGGGFRIPEILQASGATLREVGTTNKTTIDDYRRAIDQRTAMVLKVHQSNFYMGGFVDSPPPQQIAEAARSAGVPFVEDLGSGATFDTAALSQPGHGEHEPTIAEVIAGAADLVTFSGDKLLGGPQAGIIAGRQQHISALKKDPFFRALRCDKLILAGLEATVDLLLFDRLDQVPIRAMMHAPLDPLRRRAEELAGKLRESALSISIGQGQAQVGGGSLPRTSIPSITLDLQLPGGGSIDRLAAELRRGTPAVVGYIDAGKLRLDVRTIFPSQDSALLEAIRAALWRMHSAAASTSASP